MSQELKSESSVRLVYLDDIKKEIELMAEPDKGSRRIDERRIAPAAGRRLWRLGCWRTLCPSQLRVYETLWNSSSVALHLPAGRARLMVPLPQRRPALHHPTGNAAGEIDDGRRVTRLDSSWAGAASSKSRFRRFPTRRRSESNQSPRDSS